MRHRIFIAVNLPKEVRKQLVNYQSKWPELPIKWTKPENLHITLIFLGDVNDLELVETCKISKEIIEQHHSFGINLNEICYGPPKKMPPRSMSVSRSFHRSPYSSAEGRAPRMVWVKGEKSQELSDLKKDLESALLEKVNFHQENRAFSPHITLGRIRTWDWSKIEPEERPEVNEIIDLGFEVGSIDVMESELKRDGPRYIILEPCVLK